jgi:hypothetical protein
MEYRQLGTDDSQIPVSRLGVWPIAGGIDVVDEWGKGGVVGLRIRRN